MNYVIDHDYHIHSFLSSCSRDEEQTAGRILSYAVSNGFSSICLTDHFWDENVPGASHWYEKQNYPHIKESLPLPQADGVRFLFGCETEIDKYGTVGISDRTAEELDFIIVPTTHLHMDGFTIDEEIGFDDEGLKRRADAFVSRFDRFLSLSLPYNKVGLAHITCPLIARDGADGWLRVIEMIPTETLRELFTRLASKGCGLELNFDSFESPDLLGRELNVYRLALECGNKVYFGSDAHHPDELDSAKANFENIAALLDLKEEQKFRIG